MSPKGFRPGIQGLRAVAVTLVVVNHTIGIPTGGFVGVDVFYVISGYLITGLLLRELDRTGTISLRAFYARRIRRIVPAAVFVLAVTTVTAFVLWHTPRAVQTMVDAVSALLFVSNWHFIALGADYLQAASAVSPVQHYWSLSIEEQFYAVWPLVLLLAFALGRRSRRFVLVVVLAGLVLSLIWAAWRTATDPSAAYFDSMGRAWELLTGALVAVVGTAPSSWSPGLRRRVARLGIMLILVAAVVVGVDWAVPFPWVVPSVLGTALVIFAAAPAGPRSLLGNPVAQWLGKVSYSLYLWHLPVLIFTTSLWGHHLWITAACLPVMLGLSWWSQLHIEQAVLDSRFLAGASRSRNRRPLDPRDLVVGVFVLALIAVLSVSQLRGPADLRNASAVTARLTDIRHLATTSLATTPAARMSAVRQALAATAWAPVLAEQLDVIHPSQQPAAMRTDSTGCRNSVSQQVPMRVCGEPTAGGVLVIGDSVALSWVPTVQQAGDSAGWEVAATGFANCSLFDVDVTDRNGTDAFRRSCATRRTEMLELIERTRPHIVVLSASESVIEYTGLPFREAVQEWQAGVARTLTRLTEVPVVIILSNPPMAADPTECATRFSGPGSCISEVSTTYTAKTAAERSAATSFDNTLAVDVAPWFCADGHCPAFVADDILRTDRAHLTEAAATAVGPLLWAAIRG